MVVSIIFKIYLYSISLPISSISSHIANEHHSFVHVPQSQTGELPLTSNDSLHRVHALPHQFDGPRLAGSNMLAARVPSPWYPVRIPLVVGSIIAPPSQRKAKDLPGAPLHQGQSSPFMPATPPLPAAPEEMTAHELTTAGLCPQAQRLWSEGATALLVPAERRD